jgi:TonB family protein
MTLNKARTLSFQLFIFSQLLICSATVFAQDPQWQKIAPGGEDYTIEIPGQATRISQLIPIEEGIKLMPGVYDLVVNNIRYQILAFNKSSESSVPMLRDFDVFVQGFQSAFLNAGSQGDRSLTFERNVTVKDLSARQFKLQIGNYEGLVRLYDGKSHFYAVMVIGGAENDATVGRVLNSFKLGKMNKFELPDKTASSAQQPALPPEPWTRGLPPNMAPITGGVLNGKAISLPAPRYPEEARSTRAAGTVKVRILVGEKGNVLEAEAISGPSELREAATKAAMKARFSPTQLMGQPVKVSGVIVYNFVVQ